jgi:hypothetical protein
MLAGISPDNSLCATFNSSKLSIFPIDSGKGPTSMLKLTSNTVTLFNNPISEGTHPLNPLFFMIISFNVFLMFDKVEGRQPLRLLFAKTITETGELPMFSGNDDWNLLSLMNRASRFMSKRRDGMSPWNPLNRISRNLSEGRQRRIEGNCPENRLLLISSSWRRWRLPKVVGRVPQKRLEFKWKRARSVKRPSSSGSEPVMSAWLRSIPATVLVWGSSGAGAQYTPV